MVLVLKGLGMYQTIIFEKDLKNLCAVKNLLIFKLELIFFMLFHLLLLWMIFILFSQSFEFSSCSKLAYALKTLVFICSQKFGSYEFWRIAKILFSTKVNLLFLPYLMVLSYCILHLIKQCCFLKSFLRNLILATQV